MYAKTPIISDFLLGTILFILRVSLASTSQVTLFPRASNLPDLDSFLLIVDTSVILAPKSTPFIHPDDSPQVAPDSTAAPNPSELEGWTPRYTLIVVIVYGHSNEDKGTPEGSSRSSGYGSAKCFLDSEECQHPPNPPSPREVGGCGGGRCWKKQVIWNSAMLAAALRESEEKQAVFGPIVLKESEEKEAAVVIAPGAPAPTEKEQCSGLGLEISVRECW
ncbi:hypothetical protein EV426DRAFT_578171 [Tirmania nivea]|nr:hypothetical protein EV426DRAFT_578171 [Tirmania nivea]